MESRGLAIFDGDDTLWFAEELYDAALSDAELALEAAGFPGAQWRQLQRELDLKNVQALGMSPNRFPLSSQEALLEIGRKENRPVPDTLLDRVVEISRSVFAAKARLVPEAQQVLATVATAFHIALLTKGDPLIQAKRVEDSGLSSWFERIEIVAEKDERTFKQLASDFDLAPDRAWSIGNSLASDVNPALRAGLNAIWIDAHVWEHERREVAAAHTRVVVLDTLEQVPQVLLTEAHEPLPLS